MMLNIWRNHYQRVPAMIAAHNMAPETDDRCFVSTIISPAPFYYSTVKDLFKGCGNRMGGSDIRKGVTGYSPF